MKLLCELAPSSLDWFSLDPAQGSFELSSMHDSKKFLVISDENFERTLKAELDLINDENLSALIMDFWSEYPRTIPSEFIQTDLKVGNLEGEKVSFKKALMDRNLMNVFESRVAQAARRSDRKDFYNRAFRSLATLSKRVDIIDPYIAHEIANKSGGWLLQKILKDSPKVVSITTVLQENVDNGTLHDDQRRADLVKFLLRFATESSFQGEQICVNFVRPYYNRLKEEEDFHDRFLQFSFEIGGFAYQLGRGTDYFAFPRFRSAFEPAPVSLKLINSIKKECADLIDKRIQPIRLKNGVDW